jgi:hypothetical protein
MRSIEPARRSRALLISLLLCLTPCLLSVAGGFSSSVAFQGTKRTRARPKPEGKPRLDYTRFSHRTHVELKRLACDTCHKFPTKNWKDARKTDAAFADVAEFPEHSACLDCHRAQFFAGERPAPIICSNCHVAVSPRDTTRFLFPSLGDVLDPAGRRRDFVSEFVVNFPHDKHMEALAANTPGRQTNRVARVVSAMFQQKEKPKEETDAKVCLLCHQTYQPQGDSPDEYVTKPPKTLGDAFWLKKGTFKTIPVSHATCSTCHNAEVGIEPALAKCEACHKLSPAQKEPVDLDQKLPATMGITDRMMLARWQRRASAGAFTHDGGGHATLNCATCHSVPTMNTTEARTLKVAVKSCGGAEGCHITATTEDGGALNFEIDQRKAKPEFQCTKCHLTFGTQPLPPNHIEAIAVSAK